MYLLWSHISICEFFIVVKFWKFFLYSGYHFLIRYDSQNVFLLVVFDWMPDIVDFTSWVSRYFCFPNILRLCSGMKLTYLQEFDGSGCIMND